MKIRSLKMPSAVSVLAASLIAAFGSDAQSAAPPSGGADSKATNPDPSPAPTAEGGPSTIVITFNGIKTLTGAIMVSLSNDAAGFAGSKAAVAQEKISVTGPEATVVFAGLTPGRYAVRAFHDLDGDGKLKTNAFGAPLEPYAFSNNARGLAGPPSWNAASFEVGPGTTAQTIPME